mgnify:CR=1 FL=1
MTWYWWKCVLFWFSVSNIDRKIGCSSVSNYKWCPWYLRTGRLPWLLIIPSTVNQSKKYSWIVLWLSKNKMSFVWLSNCAGNCQTCCRIIWENRLRNLSKARRFLQQLKIVHSWNFRNMTSISDNAGNEVVFSDGFHYPKTISLWLNINNESHSNFNEAWFTNWERVSIVLSYSLSMRL